MNPFDTLETVQQDYLTYVRTFQRFQILRISDWIAECIDHGAKACALKVDPPSPPYQPSLSAFSDS